MESYLLGSAEVTPQNPQFVQDVRKGCSTEEISETLNIAAAGYVKDASGSTVAIDLARGPILEKSGGKIGSFWGSLQNLQYTEKVQSVVETNGSAAFAVSDTNRDLEKIFESVTSSRYIAKLTDGAGNVLYGWIGGVSVSGSVYTFTAFSGVALGTQNWFQGGSTAFAHATNGSKVEIYKYSTSVTFGSSDTFTEEMPYHAPDDPRKAGETEFRFLAGLTDGQYGFDYKNNRFLGRKANADDTEILTYKTYEQPASNVDVLSVIPGTGATNLGKAVDSPAGATDTGVAMLAKRDDALSALTPIEGDYVNLHTNANGALWVELAGLISGEDQTNGLMQTQLKPTATSTYAGTRDSSSALEASSISKASAGTLVEYFGYVDSTAPSDTYYILFLDSATLTGDGAVTHLITPEVVVHTTGTDSYFKSDPFKYDVYAANGITSCISTTGVTKTISGSYLFYTVIVK